MRLLNTLTLVFISFVLVTVSCTTTENLASRNQALAFVDTTAGFDFEKQYTSYISSSSLDTASYYDVDNGLYFLLQTSLKQEKQYAVAATQMFYTYLSKAIKDKEASSTINFVINATKALMEFDEQDAFNALSTADEQLQYLVKYWENLDPDPSTTANESVLVFGKRLAYSLDNFETMGFAGTVDARSMQVLKYGLPTIQKEIFFHLNDLNFWISRIYETESNNPNGEAVDSASPIIQRTIRHVNMLFAKPSIEIWVYDNLSPEEDRTLFYFGKKQGGKMSKLNSPEELIPRELSRNSPESSGETLLNAAGAILASMYSQLPAFHPLIAERRIDIEQTIDDRNVGSADKSMRVTRIERAVSSNTLKQIHDQLAAVILMDGEQVAIDTDSRIFRFMNDNGEGENVLFAYSNPVPALFGPVSKSIDNVRTDVQLSHSLQTIEENGVSSVPITEILPIDITPNPRANGFYPVQSIYALDADAVTSRKMRFRAMLKQVKAPKDAPIDKLTGIIAYGVNEYDLPAALELEEGKPQLSDIIFGYKVNELDSIAESSRYTLPFWVPEVAELPLGLDLSLYFEAYNLSGDKPSFILNYKLQKAGGLGILRNLKSRGNVRSVFLAQGKTHKMNLTIDLADLEEGRYNLELEITDRENGEKVKRDVEFIVIDAQKSLDDETKRIRKEIIRKGAR